MFDSQHTERETGMYEGEHVREFATWIERVTQPVATSDNQPRHRAEGEAV